MKKEFPSIIVFGPKNVNSIGLVRSLGQAGRKVVFASSCPRIESRWCAGYLHLSESPELALHEILAFCRKQRQKPVLFPADDETSYLLDRYWREFAECSLSPHAGGKLHTIADKTVMAELAVAAGLAVAPFGKLSLSAAPPAEWKSFPIILKPFAGFAGDKGDIRICRSEEELDAAWGELRKKQYSEIMLQQFLEAPGQYEIGLMGLSLPDGTVEIPGIIRKFRSWPPRRGSTSFAEFQPGLDGLDADALRRFVRGTGYIGLFDIEMICSGGKFYFLEINYRNGQYGYAPTAAGCNLPDRWAAGMLKEPLPPPALRKIFYINEREDFRYVRAGLIPLKQWWADFRRAEAFGVYCPGDQRPFWRQWIKVPDRVSIRFRKMKAHLLDLLYREEWVVAVRAGGTALLGQEGGTLQPFRTIPNSFRYWCADPFLFEDQGKTYLFFEMFDRFTAKGGIGYRILDNGKPGPLKLAYSSPVHLSFPFIFRRDGEIFMMPENSYTKKLYLLRAVHFPDCWEETASWFHGERFVDSVLLRRGAEQWLFTQHLDARGRSHELSLFRMEGADGNWVPHPGNPVVSDSRTARMAGGIFAAGGALVRPAQDCEGAYGTKLHFLRIDRLDERTFSETEIACVTPEMVRLTDRKNSFLGIHTYNCSENYEVIDLKEPPKLRLGNLLNLFFRLVRRRTSRR